MKKYAIIVAILMACFGMNSKEVKAKTLKHYSHYKIERKINKETSNGIIQTGIASWYGNEFVGRKTASGQIFSNKKFTCAHKTYPLGTTLKVKSLDNNKEIIVVVNDRGPYIKNRIVDLSPIAAKAIGMSGKNQPGTKKVEITPVNIPIEVASYYEKKDKN